MNPPLETQPDIEQPDPSTSKEGDDPIVEKVLYTHAHGHTCTRKNCNPIILSKRGIIRPERPSTAHYHLGGACSEGGEKLLPPELELKTPKTEEATERENDEQHVSQETMSIPAPARKQSDNTTQLNTAPIDPTSEKDEHTLVAAGGLLMLQNIDTAGKIDNANDDVLYDNSLLVSLTGDNEKDEHFETSNNQTNTVKNDTHLPDLEHDEPLTTLQPGTSSDDTVIYEPPVADTSPDTPQHLEETTTKKGTLIIREVGIPKPGTSTDQTPTDVMPVITTAGKVQCDFCKRAFNTLSEQKQHMVRRHLAQLQEKKEKREKEKQEVQETEQEIPDPEQSTQTKAASNQKRKREPEKDEQITKRKRKNGKRIKLRKAERDTKPKLRHRATTKITTESTRKRKRTHEKDEREKPKKDKGQALEQKVHTKQRRINRKQSTNCDRTYTCHLCDKFYDTQSELNHHHKQKHPPRSMYYL